MDFEFISMGISILFIVLIFAIFRKGNKGLSAPMSTLVLREFTLSKDENAPQLVYIEGRPSGLMNWLLTVTGIGTTTSLSVTRTELSFRASSLSGTSHSLMSLNSISSVHCGCYRPVIAFVLAIVFLLSALGALFSGEFGVFFIALLIAGVCVYIYHFNKLIRIMVQTNGGSTFGMCFKASLLEGVNMDLDKANEIIEVVNRQIMAVQNQ